MHSQPSHTRIAPPAEYDDLSAVRSILIGPEQKKIETIERAMDRPASASEVAQVLPRAMKLCVQRESQTLSDALFPIIGPAIRQAIARALRELVDRINLIAEHSLSLRAWGWRIESWRTGRPFAEIALARSLAFQVEQVFLIHHPTGLLLAEVGQLAVTDSNTVSGMLTAIMDFAKDSFAQPGASQGDPCLDELKVGQRTIVLEESHGLLLAAVVRGVAPIARIRDIQKSQLLRICQEHSVDLDRFHGDISGFADAATYMERCLVKAESPQRAPLRLGSGILVAAALVLGLLAALWTMHTVSLSRRVHRLSERLRTEPGIVLVKDEVRDGKRVLFGLRDPLAIEPTSLLAEYALSSQDVSFAWSTYYAVEPRFVLQRVRQALRPPKSVQMTFQDGTLVLSGIAPHRFLSDVERLGALVVGVQQVSTTQLQDEDRAAIQSAQKNLSAWQVHFDLGQHVLRASEKDVLAASVSAAITLYRAARALDEDLSLAIVGHTDPSGTESGNWELSRQRAEAVRSAFLARGVPDSFCVAEGAGPVFSDPASTNRDPRSVSFVVRSKSELK